MNTTRVAVADLILSYRQVRETINKLFHEIDPEVVGLSVMTFQRQTAHRIIDLAHALKPGAKIVVGGYDPSLAPDAYEGMGVDYIVRGEGEVTFRELLRALERGGGFESIRGLSRREGDTWLYSPARPVHRLEDDEIRPPNRGARVLHGYTLLGRQVDVVETSRGCTYDCSFCSIIEMRGRNFHTYSFERVLRDIRDARDRGARTIFSRGRQHYPQRAPVRTVVPCHYRGEAKQAGLLRTGHDLVHRHPRGNPRTPDAPCGIPVCFPGDRKHPGGRPAILACRGQEHRTR